ncbi:retron-type reverse transcriptase [Catenibacillus scindens]|uniref:Retron-type reverse transcriptase n=1 Tax=Catenibacillus scindens TaxID=673271 RepID=A0A7W8H7Y9_9FIRM|nr:retron-type reverse transcriptase [Catenibacillus scindens]
MLKALEMMNDGHSWIVDIDLAKFFDTVDHDKLMTIFGRTIKDGDVISVVRKFLASGVMIDDEYEDTIVGTPQGGLCGVPHNPPYADTFIMLSQSA